MKKRLPKRKSKKAVKVVGNTKYANRPKRKSKVTRRVIKRK